MIAAAEGGHGVDRFAEWDAAYVLGALSPSDRRAFERHLPECDACRAAVAELAGMPGLLSTLTPAHAESLVADDPDTDLPDGALTWAGPDAETGAGTAPVVSLVSLAHAARRSRNRRRTLGAVAASALLVAGVIGGSTLVNSGLLAPDGTSTTPATVAAAGARMVELLPVGEADMRAEVVATPTSWGTKLEWSCHYPPVPGQQSAGSGYQPPEPIKYELVVVGRDGERTVAGTWSWAGGAVTDLDASSSVALTDVDRIEITLDGHDEALASATL